MKIISKYTDFYDYISNIYGVDDKIVYKRDIKLTDTIRRFSESVTWHIQRMQSYVNRSDVLEIFTLCIVDKLYIIAKDKNNLLSVMLQSEIDAKNEMWFFGAKPHAIFTDARSEISRALGAPVVMFKAKRGADGATSITCLSIPVLSSINGLLSLTTIERVYYSIETFICEQSGASVQPVSDVLKALYAGLDPVQSFRHRKD